MDTNRPLRIVFMGTPEFAVASLDALSKTKHEIVGVVTAPDRPAGRGGKLRASAVKEYCTQKNYKLWQPYNLKSEEFLELLKSASPDLFVVVAFRMLPAVVWKIPPLGTINLHASLLPDYRGAAPINWAIVNGETQTGVTTFFINESIDTGDIIGQESVKIDPGMNAGELHDVLMHVGAKLLIGTVDQIATGNVLKKPQSEIGPDTPLNDAPKITKENARINWQARTEDIVNHIRGMAPHPGAHTSLADGTAFKIFKAIPATKKLSPGAIESDGQKNFFVGTGDGSVEILELQMAGKRRMSIVDFLNGMSNSQSLKNFV